MIGSCIEYFALSQKHDKALGLIVHEVTAIAGVLIAAAIL